MRRAFVGVLAASLLTLGVTRLIALRVELNVVGYTDQTTRVGVVVQVAPEDRRRVGSDIWVRCELLQDERLVTSVQRNLVVDDQGRVQLELEAPPGAYELQVNLESERSGAVGVWRGKAEIPARTIRGRQPEAPGGREQARSQPGEQTTLPPPSEESPSAAVEQTTPAPRPMPLPVPEPAVAGPSDPSPPERPTPAAPSPAPMPAPAPAPAEQTSPAQNELKEPAALPVHQQEPPELHQQSAAPASPRAEAEPIGDDMRELTVIVTNQTTPVTGLGASAFQLHLAGKQRPVAELAGLVQAPVALALAVDVSSSMADKLGAVVPLLANLATREQRLGASTCLLSLDEEPELTLDWGATPQQLLRRIEVGAAEQANHAELVMQTAARCTARGGRRFLLLVTDGGDTASKQQWKDAVAAAQDAGVIVFVIAFHGDEMTHKLSSALDEISDQTGGRAYYVQDTSALRMIVEQLGTLIEASYSLRFPRQPSDGGDWQRVKVSLENRDLEARYVKQLR